MRPLFLAATMVATALAGAPSAAQDAASGEFMFYTFCATCHGESGSGDGPTASILTVKPADLTALSAGNGGVFPTGRVIARIDGTDPVLAHGDPMPVYGRVFDEAEAAVIATPEGEIQTNVIVLDLVSWLEEIQR